MNREKRANSISTVGFFIPCMLLATPMGASQAPANHNHLDTKRSIEQQSLSAASASASSASASSSSASTPMTSPRKRAHANNALQTNTNSQAENGVPSEAKKRKTEVTTLPNTASASSASASASSSSAASPYPTPQNHHLRHPVQLSATGVRFSAGAHTALASGSSKEDTEATASARSATASASASASSASASSSSGYSGAQPMDLVMAANNGNHTMAVKSQRRLREPIKTYQGTPQEKQKMFIDTIANHEMLADGLNRSKSHDITQQLEKAFVANNEELYHMLHDPEFRKMYEEKYREGSFAIIRAPFQIAVKNNDTQFVKDFAKDYFSNEGPDGDLTFELIHKAAEEQNPEMMFTLIAIKNEVVRTQEQSLNTYFLFKEADSAQEELTPAAFGAYQRALALITQHRKAETVALCKKLNAAIPKMPLEMYALIAQMTHPTEDCIDESNGALVANTIMHPDLEDAISKGNIERFNELVDAGWATANNRSQLPQALKLAVKNKQYAMLDRLVILTPFTVLEPIKKDIPEPADDKEREEWKKWIERTEKWTQEKNQELITSLRDSQAIDCIRALQHGANPNVLVNLNYGQSHLKVPAVLEYADHNPVFIHILITFGADINVSRINSENRKVSLLEETIQADGELLGSNDMFYERAKMVIEAGANPNLCASNEESFAHTALMDDNIALLRTLACSKIFDANATSYDATTKKTHPLSYWAIYLKAPDKLQILLKAHANPNAFDGDGMPIALLAIKNNALACLQMLLDHKIDPKLEFTEDGMNFTLEEYALCNGYNEAYDMLVNHWPAPQAAQQQAQQPAAAAPADQKKSAETTHTMES